MQNEIMTPHDEDAEKDILASILLVPSVTATVETMICDEDFYSEKARIVYCALKCLFTRGITSDVTTLADELKTLGTYGKVGKTYISGLLVRVPTSAAIKRYCEIVKKKSQLRQMLRGSMNIASAINEDVGIEEVLNMANETLLKMNETNAQKKTVEDSFQVALRNHEKIANFLTGDVEWGLKTGLTTYDNLTAGLKGKQFVIIAGRPGMGKSTIALNIAMNVAKQEDTHVLFFSLEMSRDEISMRMLARDGRFNLQEVKQRKNIAYNLEKMDKGVNRMSNISMEIDDNSSLSISDLWVSVRSAFMTGKNPNLVIVDYAQLVTDRTEDSVQRLTKISRELKAMAGAFDIPVIALAQLNRNVEARADKRPILSDLKGSGAFEQDADMVCFVYVDKDSPEVMELDVAKNRDGATGTARFRYQRECYIVENGEFNQEEPYRYQPTQDSGSQSLADHYVKTPF